MPTFLTDAEIDRLLREPKSLDATLRALEQPTARRGSRQRDFSVVGSSGSKFIIKIRLSLENALDFSVILAYCPADVTQVVRLRRYNGRSHEHANPLEKTRFYDFHIHTATERYQMAGLKPDFYAEPTDRYSDLLGAIRCLVQDCAVQTEDDPQPRLPFPT